MITLLVAVLFVLFFSAGYILAKKKYITEYNNEVDEFNAGFDAFNAGVSVEDDPCGKYDVWSIGWYWAKACKENQ